ncbi:MAG: energy transducer TonB [Xanthomonadales bacterium]|nr:energy transducer TonB [Xanthomonadales bacterium]MCB1641719.1 energy transducer TonB [Xanthomonadales bacterium]
MTKVAVGAGGQWPWVLRGGRIVALAGTVILHVLVLGSLFLVRPVGELPRKPIPPDTTIAPVDIDPPPPLRPLVVPPKPPTPVTRVDPIPIPIPIPVIDPEPAPAEPIPIVAPTVAPTTEVTPTVATVTEATPVTQDLRAGVDYRCPKLRYPAAARRAGDEGTVLLRLRLRHDGYLAAREVLRSSGSRALDGAALAWVDKCSFSPPATDAGTMEVMASLPVSFQLR